MENILTDGQCLLPNTVLPSKFDRLNFDGLAGRSGWKASKPSKFPTIQYFLWDFPACRVLIVLSAAEEYG